MTRVHDITIDKTDHIIHTTRCIFKVSALSLCTSLSSSCSLSDKFSSFATSLIFLSLCSFHRCVIMAASSSRSLEEVCAALTLAEEEEAGLEISDEELPVLRENHSFTLVGRLLTDKPIKFHIMKDTLAAAWRPGKGVCIKELSTNLFLFQFFHELDVSRIVEDSPWAFEQSLLVLRRLKENESPFEASLNHAEFWIQLHNLPMGLMTEKTAEAIGNFIGCFIHADKSNFDGSWKSFLRIRVRLDVTKPLKRKMKIKRQGGDCVWVDFKYERLPNFCFLCGLLGHTDRYCQLQFEMNTHEAEKPYGTWLRASGRRSQPSLGQRWLVSEPPRRGKMDRTELQEGGSTEYEKSDIPGPGMGGGGVKEKDIGGGVGVREMFRHNVGKQHMAMEEDDTCLEIEGKVTNINSKSGVSKLGLSSSLEDHGPILAYQK